MHTTKRTGVSISESILNGFAKHELHQLPRIGNTLKGKNQAPPKIQHVFCGIACPGIPNIY